MQKCLKYDKVKTRAAREVHRTGYRMGDIKRCLISAVKE